MYACRNTKLNKVHAFRISFRRIEHIVSLCVDQSLFLTLSFFLLFPFLINSLCLSQPHLGRGAKERDGDRVGEEASQPGDAGPNAHDRVEEGRDRFRLLLLLQPQPVGRVGDVHCSSFITYLKVHKTGENFLPCFNK